MNAPVLEQSAPVVNPDVINETNEKHGEVSRTKNGRDREKYNAYMRSYMAKKRAKA
jgi:hypothetical protein